MEIFDDVPKNNRLDEVLSLFAKYQRRLYLYISSMLVDPAASEDVLQETNIVVWRKFDQFQPGTDFRTWVFQIAFYEVRKYLDRKRRTMTCFTPEILDELSAEYEREELMLELRSDALAGCVQKLLASDRVLIEQVYGRGLDVVELAQETGRERTSIYRSLRRIRQLLFECVERTLHRQGETS